MLIATRSGKINISKEKDTKRFSTVMNDLSDKTLKGTMKKIDKFLLNENL